MSYLLQYVRRPDSFASRAPAVRVDEHTLFKIDTLIGALQRFRAGLADEVELAERAR